MGQWIPMDSPSCPMVQWDRTDSGIWGLEGGTVDSHGQSCLSHGTVGSHRILMADLDITRVKTATMSENTYTFPKIDVFLTAILSLLAPTGNNEQASFLVHQVPHTSAIVQRYRRMFTQFFLRV